MAESYGGARVLVVDDNKVNRLLLMRSCELMGYRVAAAENGRVALEMLRRDPHDLVLLDIEMPELDGFAVLEQGGLAHARATAGALDDLEREYERVARAAVALSHGRAPRARACWWSTTTRSTGCS